MISGIINWIHIWKATWNDSMCTKLIYFIRLYWLNALHKSPDKEVTISYAQYTHSFGWCNFSLVLLLSSDVVRVVVNEQSKQCDMGEHWARKQCVEYYMVVQCFLCFAIRKLEIQVSLPFIKNKNKNKNYGEFQVQKTVSLFYVERTRNVISKIHAIVLWFCQ